MQALYFKTSTHAKCILAGEHAVLCGYPALVLPIASKRLTVFYENDQAPLQIKCKAADEEKLVKLFNDTLHHALKLLDKNPLAIRGKFLIENNISIGAGLGFSSALCVAIGRWLIWSQWLNENKLFEFSRNLENIFHGQSSGADIAGAMAEHIIHFETSGKMYELPLSWQPQLYLSYSGQPKNTIEAVMQVKKLRKEQPQVANALDSEMAESVHVIEACLKMEAERGLPLLITAINQANHCFTAWHLVPHALEEHMQTLRHLGALAVKPTGAGVGGYVLSLWDKNPPITSNIELLSVFT